jgi:hypothetical protein
MRSVSSESIVICTPAARLPAAALLAAALLAAALLAAAGAGGCESKKPARSTGEAPEDQTGPRHFSKDRQETRKRIRGDHMFGTYMGAKYFAEAKKCQFRLADLYKALQRHAAMEGKLPDSLEQLVRSGSVQADQIICPLDTVPYAYVPGQSQDMDGMNILVYEDDAAHEGKCNIVRLSGALEAIAPEQLGVELEQTRRRISGR